MTRSPEFERVLVAGFRVVLHDEDAGRIVLTRERGGWFEVLDVSGDAVRGIRVRNSELDRGAMLDPFRRASWVREGDLSDVVDAILGADTPS